MVGGTFRGDGTGTYEHTHAAQRLVAVVVAHGLGTLLGSAAAESPRPPNTIKGKGKIYLITPKGHTNPIMSDFCK